MALGNPMQSLDQIHQLLGACEMGNLSVIEALLNQGLDVDCAEDDDVTPLQVAATNGHEAVVRQLLMRGAALDKCNLHGWTPLMHAARHGHHNIVSLLLQNQADINARSKLGATSMTMAARGGHLAVCKLLVEAGIDMSMTNCISLTACEFTPLMAAAQHGHDSVVRYLLDRGFDVNYQTPSTGIGALMVAALNGHMTSAQILIEREADPDRTNVNDHTALEIATIAGKREVRGYLDRKTKNKPKIVPDDVKPDIIEAAKRGDFKRVVEILEEDPTQRDACSPQDGATPLMFAAMMGQLEMVSLLIEKGCDINKQDTVSGWTALMQATYHGKKNVAKYLVNAGADVLVPAKNGCTAFDMACLIDDVDTELYRLLASKAVQVSKADSAKRGKNWNGRQNGTAASTEVSEAHPRSGLKAWWSRMSNRFRNLKLGRTFTLTSNRLAPLPFDSPPPTESNLAITDSTSSQIVSSPTLPRAEIVMKSVSVDTALDAVSSGLTSSTVSYESLMMETKKTATLYTLGLNHRPSTLQDGNLRPVIPPFLPPPTFETDRPKMPPVSARKSVGSMGSTSTLTSTKPIVRPMKFLHMYSSSQTLNSAASPTMRQTSTNASPSSSGGASGLSVGRRVQSSLSTSSIPNEKALKGHHTSSDSIPSAHISPVHGPGYLANDPAYQRPPAHPSSGFLKSSHISPNSSTSDSSSLTPRKNAKSGSSRSRSTNSTLTPSPSPTPKVVDDLPPVDDVNMPSTQLKVQSPEQDELGGILKSLSLERYQPIFEKEEVDMEAFLTLTDHDLKELGVSRGPRNQILTYITELQTGKGRERMAFQETMSQFESAQSSTLNAPSCDLGGWNVAHSAAEDQQLPPEDGEKSRSS